MKKIIILFAVVFTMVGFANAENKSNTNTNTKGSNIDVTIERPVVPRWASHAPVSVYYEKERLLFLSGGVVKYYIGSTLVTTGTYSENDGTGEVTLIFEGVEFLCTYYASGGHLKWIKVDTTALGGSDAKYVAK